MAQDHYLQDTPSTSSSKVSKQQRDSIEVPLSAAKGPGPAAVGLLGVNAWALSVGWTLLSTDVSMRRALLSSVGLLTLALGVWLRTRAQRDSWQTLARWCLLCVFPLTLSGALCLGSELERERAHSAVSMSWAALSVLAYCGVALQLCRVPLSVLPSKSHARRREVSKVADPHRLSKNLAAGCLMLGALAIAWIAPLSSDYAELEAAWGEAADAGAALTAVVAGAIAVTVVGVELGLLLRANVDPPISPRRRRIRIATMLLSAAFGGAVYLVVFW